MLFEIRNYHFNPDLLEAYKAWAKAEAIPHLSQKLEVLGFWVNTNDAPEIYGEPLDKLGSANVTWIIKWRDLSHRNEVMPNILSSPELADILSRVPGGLASYLRVEAKFTENPPVGAFTHFNSGRDITLFEIRNYHFNPDLFEAFKEWGKTEAAPYLSQHLDILGRWMSTKDKPEIYGEPQDKLGSANFTWIIRWKDLAHRNTVWASVGSSPECQDIFTRVPGGMASFLRIEAKFAESLA